MRNFVAYYEVNFPMIKQLRIWHRERVAYINEYFLCENKQVNKVRTSTGNRCYYAIIDRNVQGSYEVLVDGGVQ